MKLTRIHKYLLTLGAVVGLAYGTWVVADTHTDEDIGDDLPTLDTIEVRASMQRPKMTLPSELTVIPVVKPGEYYVPPKIEDLDDSKYADEVRLGRNIFIDTQHYAKRFVGNGLNCSSCHLQEGRKPNAAPLWAAYPLYPMYRDKSRQVISYQERLQDCFRFSMNGMAPTLDSREIEALTSYAQWLSSGIPVGTIMPGRGFARIDKTEDPSPFNGAIHYKQYCASCHGDNLEGKKFTNRDGYMFPPLAGPDSYNKGAGMHKVKTCAGFIKANMPLGKPNTLTDDQALDICVNIFVQDRPWDPRKGMFMSIFMPVSEG
jgi:thiosulfate dehydrogenase